MPPKGSKKVKPAAEPEAAASAPAASKGRAKATTMKTARGKRGEVAVEVEEEEETGVVGAMEVSEETKVTEPAVEVTQVILGRSGPVQAVPHRAKGDECDIRDKDSDGGDVMMVDDDQAASAASATAIAFYEPPTPKRAPREGGRLSDLPEPTMQLTGHEGPVYSISFDSTGRYLASASFDRDIFLWDITASPAAEGSDAAKSNYNVLSGHKNAVLEVHWVYHHGSSSSSGSSGTVLSCSADKTVALWDAHKGLKIRKFADHTNIVNSCSYASTAIDIMCSGGDDNFALVYDARERTSVSSVQHDYQLTAVCMSADGQTLYTGGIDNIVRSFDLRNPARGPVETLIMPGHNDTITGLCVSPDGSKLLSNAMDSTLRQWDVSPFVRSDLSGRCTHIYQGIHHGAEKNLLKCCYSADAEYVSCGSADKMVHVFDAMTGKLVFYLPGHKGSVNQVLFHPHDPVIASCSTDRTIFIGELQ